MTEQEKPRTPEELQAATRQAFNSIPVFYSVGDFFRDIENLPPEERDKAIEGRGELPYKSELVPLLVRRFDELISLSPTTGSFKKAALQLFEAVCKGGRVTEPSKQDDFRKTDALYEALELGNPHGVYSTKGAIRGEAALYSFVCEDFGEGVENSLLGGDDPMDPDTSHHSVLFQYFTLGQYRDFILNWHTEFEKHYGDTPFNA